MFSQPPVRPHTARLQAGAFTLIELLVVIVIVAILAALLFPVIGRVQNSATRASCASNLKQCGVALIAYSADNDQFLPPLNRDNWPCYYQPTYIPGVGVPKFTEMMRPYVKDFRIWRCPKPNAVPIDDPSVTAFTPHANYQYYPGRTNVAGSSLSSTPISPSRMTAQTATTVLMSDELYFNSGSAIKWRANHSTSSRRIGPEAASPSYVTFGDVDAVPEGRNVLFGDGHVSWVAHDPSITGWFYKPTSTYQVPLIKGMTTDGVHLVVY